MRFLADENVSKAIVHALITAGHDVMYVAQFNAGLNDHGVLALAVAEDRILLTFDKDFGELARTQKHGSGYGIVLFRIPMKNPSAGAALALATFSAREDWSGHFSVVEEGGVRMRRLK